MPTDPTACSSTMFPIISPQRNTVDVPEILTDLKLKNCHVYTNIFPKETVAHRKVTTDFHTHCQFHFFTLVLHIEGPPTLDPFVFEERHLRHTSVCLQHVEGAQLGRLGTPRETVQVQRERPWEGNNGSRLIVCTSRTLNMLRKCLRITVFRT